MGVLSNRYHFSNVYRIVQLSTYRYEEIIQFSFELLELSLYISFVMPNLFEIIQPVEQNPLFTESGKQPLGAAGGTTRYLTGESLSLGTRSDRFSTLRPQPCPLPPLTSSLLTSMFHTAIPPSEEQETSCLVS